MRNIYNSKHLIVTNIINDKKHISVFKNLNNIIMDYRFNNISDRSVFEDILVANSICLTKTDINKIINSFINKSISTIFSEDRSIYEAVKVFNIETKMLKNISQNTYSCLLNKLREIYLESDCMSYLFLILRIVNNIIIKTPYKEISSESIELRKKIIDKLLNYPFKEEKKKETTIFCWLEMLFNLYYQSIINIDEYSIINLKIINITNKNLSICCKLLNILNYAINQNITKDKKELTKQRLVILDIIKSESNLLSSDINSIRNFMIDTLSKKAILNESFFYLLDLFKAYFSMPNSDKMQCLIYFEYIAEFNNVSNIFNMKEIRKAYFSTLSYLLAKCNDLVVREEFFEFILFLMHLNVFNKLHRQELFYKAVEALKIIGIMDYSQNHIKFFKYCDALDFILYKNIDIRCHNIIRALSSDNIPQYKIMKRFELYRMMFTYKKVL